MPEILCTVSDHTFRCWAGTIEITEVENGCAARFIWDDGYGEREIEEGPVAFVIERVLKLLRYGPAFGPVHQRSEDGLRWKAFAADVSERATRPHGEVRIKPFLGEFVLLFVPDGGFRLIAVNMDPFMLRGMAATYGARWASLGAPRLAVEFEGKHRELQVSNFAGELAYLEVDERTKFSLVPHGVPEGDRPATAALYLVRDDVAELLAVVPIDPNAGEVVIWSDKRSSSSRSTSCDARPPTASAAASTGEDGTRNRVRAHAADAAASEPAAGPLHPGVRALLLRYLDAFASEPGLAKDLREEISPHLMRGAERGANVAGWGMPLQRGLERACDFRSSAARRTFCYFVGALRRDGILVRPGTNPRKSEFVFAELRRLDSLAVAQLCAWAGVTVESLDARPQSPESTVASRASKPAPTPPVPGRTPPMSPPASRPWPGRETATRAAPSRPEADTTTPGCGERTPGPSPDDPGGDPPKQNPDSRVPPTASLNGTPGEVTAWSRSAVLNDHLRSFVNEQLASFGTTPESSPPAGADPPPRAPRSRPVDPLGCGVLEPEFLFLDPRILRTSDDDDDDLPTGGSARGPPDET